MTSIAVFSADFVSFFGLAVFVIALVLLKAPLMPDCPFANARDELRTLVNA